jgi:hypothetical protein
MYQKLSWILLAAMLFSLLGISAYAADAAEGTAPASTQETKASTGLSFGYDADASGGDVSGVTVQVGDTVLKQGESKSTAGAAVKSGVTLTFKEGYYLAGYRIVFGEKYAKANADIPTVKVGERESQDGYKIALTAKDFENTGKQTTAWLLLDVQQVFENTQTATDTTEAAPAEDTKQPTEERTDAAEPDAAVEDTEVEPTTAEKTTLTVSIGWNDQNNNDGVRPASVQVQLYANDVAVGEPVSVTDTYTYAELPVSKDGEKLSYTVKATEPGSGYTLSYETKDDTVYITGTREATKTFVTVTNKWDDKDNRDGIRPASVKVQLYADGTATGEPVTVTDSYTFSGLAAYTGGKEIKYTIKALDLPTGYTTAYAYKDGNVTMTNSYQAATTSVSVQASWVDNSDAKKARPSSITVQLYANGEKYGSAVQITSGMSWKYTFTDLPKNKDGKAITYSVQQTSVKNYVTKYSTKDGTLTITNTYSDIPLTGDSSNLLFWILTVIAASTALMGICVEHVRKSNRR